MKKTVALLLSLIILLSAASCGKEEYFPSYEPYEQSVVAARKFKEEFTQYSGEGTNKRSKLVYPDNFAGLYIGEDHVLYILYTHDKESLMNNVSEKEAVFKQVDYGYNYLEKVRAFATYYGMAYSATSCYIDEKENKVAVHIAEENRDALIERLYQTLDGFDENTLSFRPPMIAVAT